MRRILAGLAGLAFLIVPSLASAQLKAPGEVRWFVDDATNVIVNSTSFASVPIPPGHTVCRSSPWSTRPALARLGCAACGTARRTPCRRP